MELTEIGLLAVKTESTYGTDPTPTAALNLIPTVGDGVQFSPAGTHINRKPMRHGHARIEGINSRKHVVMRFDYELRGNRVDGSDPDVSVGSSSYAVEIDALLQAADLDPTYTAESSGGAHDGDVTYRPIIPTDQGKSVTCYFWTQKKLHILTGGKVNIERIAYTADGIPIVTFAVTGFYNTVADATFPSATADYLVDTKPPLFTLAGGFIFNTDTDLVVENFEIGLGNEIALRPDANSTNGVKGFAIVDRLVQGSFDPESETVAAHNFFGEWAASSYGLAIVTVGSQSGNRVQLTSNATILEAGYSSRNKLRTHAIQFQAERQHLGVSPNSEFVLKFY